MSNTAPAKKMGRIQQFRETYKMASRTDRWLGLYVVAAFVLGAALGALIFWFMPGAGLVHWILLGSGAFMLGLLAAMIVFGRRAQGAMYKQMEGQIGAAAGAMQVLGKVWRVTPAIGFNKQQDVVHRAVGPPGIVLVGEGNSNRLRNLLAAEKRRHERVISDVPIHEVVCGNGEGEVPLPKLVRHLNNLGKNIKPADITIILNRMKAMDAMQSNIPMPKGPIPTSMKGMRGNLRGR